LLGFLRIYPVVWLIKSPWKQKSAEVLAPLADALNFLVDDLIFGADRSVARLRRSLRNRSVDTSTGRAGGSVGAGSARRRGRPTGARTGVAR
jgi:hypothetical protein